MAQKDSASFDPGWNDPPLFSYNSQSSHLNSKPRTFLNKRVAFPLNEASPPTSSNYIPVDPTAPLPSCNISKLPPPPAGTLNLPKENISKDKSITNRESVEIPSHALETVVKNFNEAVDKQFENQEKDKIEVIRRLDTMKKMWSEDKLCKDIQQRLLQLSEALKDNKLDIADDLQKGLMVDHGSACSPWMSGIRCLIRHNQQEESQP